MITSKVESIGPAKATELLNHFNNNNRKLSTAYANKLAKAMKSGHWEENGSSIILDKDGNLVDGQHRLKAIVISGTTINTLVVRGVPSSAFNTIDYNRVRSTGDVLGIRGIQKPATVGGIVRIVAMIRRDGNYSGRGGVAPARYEILDMLEIMDRERLYASTLQALRIKQAVGGSASVFGAILYLAPKLEIVDKFWDQIETGIGLVRGSHAALLRAYMISNSRGTSRLSDGAQFIACVKTMNAFIEGRLVKIIKVAPGETAPRIYAIKTRK